MKKLVNNQNNILNETISGLAKAHPEIVKQLNDLPIIIRADKKTDKVGLVSGGGSGHEPSHAGFVGFGMLDAAVAGEIFTSPSADKVYEAIKAADSNKGVLLIIKNYTGDVLNFELAAEMARNENIEVDQIIVNDDIAVNNSTYTVGRRGIAGTVLVHKIVGAAAENGYSLKELVTLGNKVISNLKTMGMSLKPCTVLSTGKKSFEIDDDKVEIGLGIHGEPGTHQETLRSANEIVKDLMIKLQSEAKLKANDEIALLVNGLGATTLIELYLINNYVNSVLTKNNIKIAKTFVGNYMTSLDMEGFSLTFLKLDDETKKLLMSKSKTIAFNMD